MSVAVFGSSPSDFKTPELMSFTSLAEICGGCLSTNRQLKQLQFDEAQYFKEIVRSVIRTVQACPMLCWECAGEIRRSQRLQQRIRTAQTELQMLLLHKNGFHTPKSLSNLSQHTPKVPQLIICEETDTIDRIDEESRPLFIKMEAQDDDNGFEGLYVDESEQCDERIDDKDLKAVLKDNAVDFEEITTDRSKMKTELEFDASDDEPLTLKKEKKKREGKKRGRKKKSETETATKPQKRGRREKPAGVVNNARIQKKLELLNVPPGALEMVVLTWEEVESERQLMLSSVQYTRHEHRCGRCAVGFNHRAKLEQHMLKHDPQRGDLECSACHIRCRDQHALAAHRRRHRVRWRCVQCGGRWSRAGVAADHLTRAHAQPAPTHVCPTCGHVAQTLGKLRSHLKEHAERQRCELCGKSFRDRASLRTHLFIHRGEKEHVCSVCGKKFLFKKALQLHQQTHEQPAYLYCHQCDVTFKNRMSYYQHMKYNLKHIDPEKLKYACTLCPKKFAKSVRLSEHTAAVHLKSRPVRCGAAGCSFGCASRPVLRAHVRRQHAPQGGAGAAGGGGVKRDHVCHTCGKAYTAKKTLEGHLRSHSGERPFHCSLCNASFGYHAALYNHTRLVHLNKSGRSISTIAPREAWPTTNTHENGSVT